MHLVFDIEADKLNLHEVTKVHCIVAEDIISGEIYEFGPDEILSGIVLLGNSDRLIGHNIIWYDLPVLQKLFGFSYYNSVIDTLILSRLANPDRKSPFGYTGKSGPHSIEVWGARLGKGYEKIENENWDEFTPLMLDRCRRDVRINVEVYKALYNEFKEPQ